MDGGRGTEPQAVELPLFRPEVLEQRQSDWLGPILLRPRPLHRWFAGFAAVVVVVLAAALALGSYTRRARVQGWLVPAEGMVRVFAPRAGVTTALMVREGLKVEQGDVLVSLSTEEQSMALGATGAQAARALLAQRESLLAEAGRNALLLRQQRRTLDARLAAMADERGNIEQEIALQQAGLARARQWEERLKELQGRGFITEQQVRTAAEATLEQAGRVRALERSLLALERERAALEGELKDLPLKMAAQDALVERSVAANLREQAEVEARRALNIPAPASGTVTAIHAAVGTAVGPGAPLLSIVPRGATLEAHLYAPSRAIGFVRPRQEVLLRYRAYPYQKFGHYRGVITSVSRSAIEPAELPAMFAAPGAQPEPMYRIAVALARQHVQAYGQEVALQPGMQLDADILLERRRLYEWVLDPFYALAGSMKR